MPWSTHLQDPRMLAEAAGMAGRPAVQNLSHYRISGDRERTYWDGLRTAFDIERWAARDGAGGFTMEYAFMIDGYGFKGEPGTPTREAYAKLMTGFPRFARAPDTKLNTYWQDPIEFHSSADGIFTNWSCSEYWEGLVCVGVVSLRRMPRLDDVLAQLPLAVRVFNQAYPARALAQDMVGRSIAFAQDADRGIDRPTVCVPAPESR